MELAARYCRSCGSRLLIKNVCHNCNSDPLKGDNYCYDCGALTPHAVVCMKCGAKFKKKFPLPLAALFAVLLIIGVGAAGYYFLNSDNDKDTKENDAVSATSTEVTAANKPDSNKVESGNTITNNSVDTNLLAISKPADTTVLKISTPSDTLAKAILPIDSSALKKPEANIFSSNELKAYKIKCSYFEKKQKGAVLFFIASGLGYIKVNDKIVELKRTKKSADISIYSGNEYEAIITIDGLTGSEKEWLAAGTLTVKNILQKSSVKYKINSYCLGL
ncbi:MAG: hypothetical protein M3004_07050 [Bacteroidota bacterium]|nr:hypothetical protein [Bacteroidota bacterium]